MRVEIYVRFTCVNFVSAFLASAMWVCIMGLQMYASKKTLVYPPSTHIRTYQEMSRYKLRHQNSTPLTDYGITMTILVYFFGSSLPDGT